VHTRSFDWRDLPRLHAYRNETLFLNKALFLTRGPLQTLGAMLASVVPTVGIFTGVCDPEDPQSTPLIGQAIHKSGEPFAYISFLAPEPALIPEYLAPLMDYLVLQVAGRGILRILAEVEERSPVLESFRYSGFAVYTRQRIWLLPELEVRMPGDQGWRTANSHDLFAIRLLYGNLVPGLVQSVEPVSFDEPRGLVYYHEGELMAYVELKYGLRGIWARPFVHPDVEEATHDLARLLLSLPSRHNRPVYLCVSAYQSWMDGILEDMGASASPRQVLMVRHLTVQKKLERALPVQGLEAHPETFAFSELER
jgi:hypothetical protein